MKDLCILPNIIQRQARKYEDKTVITYVNENRETLDSYSWARLEREVGCAACAMETLGIEKSDKILIFSPNRPEMIITDFAAYRNGAAPISIYSTSSVEQAAYTMTDCQAKMAFVGGPEQAAAMDSALSLAGKEDMVVVAFDKPTFEALRCKRRMLWADILALGDKASDLCRKAVDERREGITPEDIATFIYTSGTTGEPKGAVLTHDCFDAIFAMHDERLTMLSDRDASLCFLPLSHIFEKAWSYYCLTIGIPIAINQNAKEIAKTLAWTHPTCMCSVPRFWEKAYQTINEKMAKMPLAKRMMMKAALRIGKKRNLQYSRLGLRAPWHVERAYQFFDKTVFSPVRRLMGVDRANILPTAGAPISSEIVEFFRAIGIPVLVGYGLSETTATVTCYPQTGYVIGSVGTVMPHLEVRIGLKGEIQVKGRTVMKEYHNKPQATAEAFTEDGWFRTGDAGYFDDSGALVLTERLKDLFKTSNGKYIAPQALETMLGSDKYIEQVAIVGESRKYVTAIIIPAFEALKEYAKKKKIAFRGIDDLIQNSEIIQMLQDRIEKMQKALPSFERIKKFTLLPKAFTIESGELTNTLKIRRPVIAAHYAKEIEAMY
ncbi:MAG: long-chain fatty acid--CoA ligase [Clostridium sp.]|nr:long-chain fatty acid--CoA ligase [Clostridium sp.]